MKVCRTEQTKKNINKNLPVIDVRLDITPQEKTTMLVDTGAQISLINNKIIADQTLINPENKITIQSIHGSERTLGDISANIHKNNQVIPIQLQVTKNSFLKEDGILGYDILGEKAVINGPNRTVTINTGKSQVKFPICSIQDLNMCELNRIQLEIPETEMNSKLVHDTRINDTIQQFQNIEYVTKNEISPTYLKNLTRTQDITQEINESKIRIQQHYKS